MAGTFTVLPSAHVSLTRLVETWYIGPVAKKFGQYGGDLGFEFAFVLLLSFVSAPADWAQRRFFARRLSAVEVS